MKKFHLVVLGSTAFGINSSVSAENMHREVQNSCLFVKKLSCDFCTLLNDKWSTTFWHCKSEFWNSVVKCTVIVLCDAMKDEAEILYDVIGDFHVVAFLMQCFFFILLCLCFSCNVFIFLLYHLCFHCDVLVSKAMSLFLLQCLCFIVMSLFFIAMSLFLLQCLCNAW